MASNEENDDTKEEAEASGGESLKDAKEKALNLFERNPFKPKLPRGWTRVVEDVPTAQASSPSTAVRR